MLQRYISEFLPQETLLSSSCRLLRQKGTFLSRISSTLLPNATPLGENFNIAFIMVVLRRVCVPCTNSICGIISLAQMGSLCKSVFVLKCFYYYSWGNSTNSTVFSKLHETLSQSCILLVSHDSDPETIFQELNISLLQEIFKSSKRLSD